MKIQIKSREALESEALLGFKERTAIISITDIGDKIVNLKNKPQFLLRLEFNDISHDSLDMEDTVRGQFAKLYKLGMIKSNQAQEIARFYLSHKDNIDVLICQCEHGQSRSAAVAAAILEFRSKKGINVFASDNYYPNKVVFRSVLNALKKESNNE